MRSLKEDVVDILEENGFDYCEYSGCFDFIAKKDSVFLLKLLQNIDSFQHEQAESLKVLSRQFVAYSFVIGSHTRRELLKNNIVYERFDIPSVTPRTFENIIGGDAPKLFRLRGGLFVNVSPDKLKEKRVDAGMTQQSLADKIGITKKSVYEHEKKEMPSEYCVAKKMEKMLGDVTEPVRLVLDFDVKTTAKTTFEFLVSKDLKRLGFSVDFVRQSPFNIIASEEKFIVLSEAEERVNRKKLEGLTELYSVTKKPVIAVTKNEISADLPSVTEKELRKMSKKEFLKAVR